MGREPNNLGRELYYFAAYPMGNGCLPDGERMPIRWGTANYPLEDFRKFMPEKPYAFGLKTEGLHPALYI